jgi:hypothetical protein
MDSTAAGSQRPAAGKRRGPAGRADALAAVRLRKRAIAWRSACRNGPGGSAGVQARTAAARKAPPRPRSQRGQKQERALRKLAAFAVPDEGQPRPAETTAGQLA